MSLVIEPWARRFRPRTMKDLVNNERAIREFTAWVKTWSRGTPEKRAVFLYGPPGVGKTSAVITAANDLGFDLIEVNASDFRTGKRLESIIGRSASQGFNVLGRRRMILFDEMEGVSGREDEGGIAEITRIIKETRNPVVLVATSISESWEEKFAPLREVSLLIDFDPIPFRDVVRRLKGILQEMKISADEEVMELISERSTGDLRSAINDMEALATGKSKLTLEDVKVLGERDRQTYTPDALMKIFSARSLREARQVVGSSYLSYDELFEWIYENLPSTLDDPEDLAHALDALAMADIHEGRARRTQDYRLLKYMFADMTGGVALSRRRSKGSMLNRQASVKLTSLGFPASAFSFSESPDGIMIKPNRFLGDAWKGVNSAMRGLGGYWNRTNGCWILPYFRPPQAVWLMRRTWHRRRVLRALAEKIGARCHISTKEAVREVVPLVKIMFRGNKGMANELSEWLDLDEKESEWLKTAN